jgi:Na+/melibiose symporter-like transporter
MRALLRHRDARLYILGQSLSTLGDSALWLAMAIWMKILTGSSSAAGLVFLAFTCGILLAPVTGLVADRVRRRPLLVVANLAAAAGVCALLLVGGRGQAWLIYLIMFGYGAVNSLITSAQTALLAVLLPAGLLGEANSALQLAAQGFRLISPLLGAGLLAWVGPQPVILLDAATFVAAAGAVAALRMREAAPVPAAAHWRAEVTAGISHIVHTAALRRLLVTGVIALLVFGFFETVPFAVIGRGLHRPPTFLGVLEAVMGAGAVAGGVLAAAVMRRSGERGLVALGLLGSAAGCLLLMPGWLPPVAAGMALIGLSIVWVNVGAITLIQRRTPAALLGRVDAALTVAITVPQVVSIALGAALVAVVDYRVLLAVMAAVIMVSAAYLVGRPDPAARQQDASAVPAEHPAADGVLLSEER